MKTFVTYFGSGVLVGILLLLLFNRKTTEEPEVEIKYIERVVEIPGSSGNVIDSIPYPVFIENKVNTRLLNEVSALQKLVEDSIIDKEIIDNIIDATRVRYYEKTFTDTTESGDTSLRITTKDSVSGKKTYSAIDWKIYPRQFKYTEKQITYFKKPKFAVSGTIKTTLAPIPVIDGTIGIRTKKGYLWGVGYNTLKQKSISVGKDIWTKY